MSNHRPSWLAVVLPFIPAYYVVNYRLNKLRRIAKDRVPLITAVVATERRAKLVRAQQCLQRRQRRDIWLNIVKMVAPMSDFATRQQDAVLFKQYLTARKELTLLNTLNGKLVRTVQGYYVHFKDDLRIEYLKDLVVDLQRRSDELAEST